MAEIFSTIATNKLP